MSSNKFERGSYKNKDGKVVETFSLNLGLKKFKVGEEVVSKNYLMVDMNRRESVRME